MNEMLIKLLSVLPQSMVRRIAGRYIAGDTRKEAIDLARSLRTMGFVSTIDLLGEDIKDPAAAGRAAGAYVDLIEAMELAEVERNISIKLTQLGIRLDRGRAFDLTKRVVDEAAKRDFFVRFDMEDASVTDITLEFYRRAREIWPKVGTVLQARLKRTLEDARQMKNERANIRLCKGIYPEKPDIALTDREEIRESYLEILDVLADGGAYIALASHDLPLIRKARKNLLDRQVSPDHFEFQALLGVPIRRALLALRDDGYKVRIYIPYGDNWYAYSMRRFKENPKMAIAIAKSLLKHDRLDAQEYKEGNDLAEKKN